MDIIKTKLLKIWVILVLLFLILPIIVIIPLSFNAQPFFSFTAGMLNLDPNAYSTRWYQDFFNNEVWQLAIKNSLYFATTSAIFATILGTLAALSLHFGNLKFKSLINAIIIAPMIVPLVIVAAGMYLFYSKIHIINSDMAIIIAHTVLGVPFVVITVNASLGHFDKNLLKAAYSLGATPIEGFFQITLPIIKPGVISGALFAFVTSFDEIIIVLFMANASQKTIPKQMFSGLREQISPTILAVATILLLVSIILLFTIEYLKKINKK